MARQLKPRFTAMYGWNWIREFTGTKRAIINRLKRANFMQAIDTLIIFPEGEWLPVFEADPDGAVYPEKHNDYSRDFFTAVEWYEMFGIKNDNFPDMGVQNGGE